MLACKRDASNFTALDTDPDPKTPKSLHHATPAIAGVFSALRDYY